MIRPTNGTQQDREALRRLADQAQAEASSGVIAYTPTACHDLAFLEGVEAALRWAAGDGNTDELAALIARSNEADQFVVVDELNQQIIGKFATADEASAFITPLPGAEEGRYGIDGPEV